MSLIKKILIFFVFISIKLIHSQWTAIGPPGNLSVTSITINGANLFAGTSGGIYISTNDGQNWAQTSFGNLNVHSLASGGANIFAGTLYNGVYISTNNGLNWSQTALNNQFISAMFFNNGNIFAGTDGNGIYSSSNNGQNWTQTLSNQHINSIILNGSYMYAGSGGNGVFISQNYGLTWTQSALDNQIIYALASFGQKVFAGTPVGVLLSTNNGQTWGASPILPNLTIWSLAVSASNIFAGTDDWGVYLSTNSGANWTQRNEGMGELGIQTLVLSSNYIYAGTDKLSAFKRSLKEIIGIINYSSAIPKEFSIKQNYPNPFNPSTSIKFDLPPFTKGEAGGFIILKIYNVLGKEVATLVNRQLQPGSYEVTWDASNFPSGVYFYKLQTENYSETKKMILLK